MEVEETTLKLIAEMMRSFSQILKAVTEIEEAGGQPFDEVLKKLFSPEKLAEMRNRVPPNLYAVFAVSLFKLTAAASKLQNPLALSTEEKKKLSNDTRSRNNGKDSCIEAIRARYRWRYLCPSCTPPYQLR